MKERPLRASVIGSLPFPAWLEHASLHLAEFGPDDLKEMQDDAVVAAIHDQVAAGLDVITDGEQTRLDFNLSFYGYIDGIDSGGGAAAEVGPARARPAGPPPDHGRPRGPARPWRGGGVHAPGAAAPARCRPEGERSRARTRSAAGWCPIGSTRTATRWRRPSFPSCGPRSMPWCAPGAARSVSTSRP